VVPQAAGESALNCFRDLASPAGFEPALPP
jgi:hypothetical protein